MIPIKASEMALNDESNVAIALHDARLKLDNARRQRDNAQMFIVIHLVADLFALSGFLIVKIFG